MLKAIKEYKEYNRQEEVFEKIIKFLYSERKENAYWLDKWNISPYYCTGLAMEAIGDLDRTLTNGALDWMLKSQNPDGSWGQSIGNLEETSYVLSALLDYHLNLEKLDNSILLNGLRFLENNFHNDFYPELWIGKGLYCPENVIKANILSTMYLGKKINK